MRLEIGPLIIVVLVISALGFWLGKRRALSVCDQNIRSLNSLPHYHGFFVSLQSALPALFILCGWALLAPTIIDRLITPMISVQQGADGGNIELILSDVHRLASGLKALVMTQGISAGDLTQLQATDPDLMGKINALGVVLTKEIQTHDLEAAKAYYAYSQTDSAIRGIVVIFIAIAGLIISVRRITIEMRARAAVERFILVLLVACALVAVATTFGILASLIIESLHFFKLYPMRDFFFSLTWNPQFRGNSDLGIWPLLWGTFYISFIALLVAVPTGLMAAIYLSEYAGRLTRSIAKPTIEILAGIPTIVYGLFALITVGPFLRDYFAEPLGLGRSSSSVMTAGLVMGIMLIPFVSSLADDIMNAVPQGMRDGSFGLGATQSETVKNVVLPAALPGIVGAILLAASRAIGETMIVVLGAGAAAKLDLNPFEAMTTVTVKIVSQLTGDTEFASPETLVAFAMGLTLFCVTLALNILALYIVRKYREQYE